MIEQSLAEYERLINRAQQVLQRIDDIHQMSSAMRWLCRGEEQRLAAESDQLEVALDEIKVRIQGALNARDAYASALIALRGE